MSIRHTYTASARIKMLLLLAGRPVRDTYRYFRRLHDRCLLNDERKPKFPFLVSANNRGRLSAVIHVRMSLFDTRASRNLHANACLRD